MATLIDGTVPCVDPSALYQYCTGSTPPIPTDWVGKANLFRVPLGRGPGTGGVLLRDYQLSALDLTVDHELTFADAVGNRRTLKKITLLRGRVLTPAGPDDDGSTFLVDVADRRHFLAKIPIDKAYNVPAADGLTYLASTLNAGVAWTWQTMVQNIATTLGLGTMTLPFTPDGTPENFTFWVTFAWEALNQVLDRLACTIKYNIETDAFSIIQQGAWTSAGAVVADNLRDTLAAKQFKLWDDYANEPYRGRFPEKLQVTFPRRPQPTDGTSPWYTYDVTLNSYSGIEAGTFEIVHDDLTAVGAGVPTNLAALALRAAERASDWGRKRLHSDNRLTLVYRDFQEGMNLLAANTGDIAYDDASGANATGVPLMVTEVSSKPDGLIERFRPYEPPFLPGELYSGVTSGAIASLATGTVVVSGVGNVSVYNQWSTTIADAKKCIIGFTRNDGRFQFIAVDC